MSAKKKEEAGMVPLEQESAIVPADQIDSGMAIFNEMQNDVNPTPSGLTGTDVYRQSKADSWKKGESFAKEVYGILLYTFRSDRAFWPPGTQPDGSNPTCLSLGGEAPHEKVEDKQAESCAKCRWNELGTAGLGEGKACKVRASDFILELNPDFEVEESGTRDNKKYTARLTQRDIIGPAIVQYSNANGAVGRNYSDFVKQAKMAGGITQGAIGRWTLRTYKTKKGVEYQACHIEVLAGLPNPNEDPLLWGKVIIPEYTRLKDGDAKQALEILSGLTAKHETE